MFLAEEEEAGFSNACVLVGRDGEPAVTYRKVFPVSAYDHPLLEGSVTPGTEFPVFDCDFGRLGMQICFDGCYPEGWAALGATGAEVVVWPTMSPQTVRPAAYAHEHGYHVVTSTWRNNATIFRPNGMVAAQIRDPDRLLVHRIDLSYAVVTWQPALQRPRADRGLWRRRRIPRQRGGRPGRVLVERSAPPRRQHAGGARFGDDVAGAGTQSRPAG